MVRNMLLWIGPTPLSPAQGAMDRIDNIFRAVYCLCMPTKTISVELDAYEKLSRARTNPKESFSSVIRRATWPAECRTGGELLERIRARMESGEELPDEAVLDRLDRAQRNARRSRSAW